MYNLYTSAHSAVDTIQNSKKQFVNFYVKHKSINSTLNQFIDAQTKYTKAAIDTGIATTVSLTSILSSANFYNEMVDIFKVHTNTEKEKS